MKSVALTGLRKLALSHVAVPKILRGTELLLKIDAIGVCGSDIHYYTTGRIGSQVVKYPFRVGHECSATVVEAGRAVKRLKIGDRVAVDPAQWCGKCDQCLAGRFHTCRKLKFLGTPGQGEGCLCEFIVMPEASCFRVSKKTTPEQAALVEPLSIGLYAVKLAGVPLRGLNIGILGCGPIGMSVLLGAQDQKAGKIYVTDKIDARLRLASQAGADWIGNARKPGVAGAIATREPLLLDVVFECCGQQAALDQAVDLLKPGGTLVLVGIPEVDRVSFAIDKLRRKEIAIRNVRRQNECVQEAIDLIEKRGVDVDFMITHRFALEQTKEAFDLVASYADGVFKAMIVL